MQGVVIAGSWLYVNPPSRRPSLNGDALQDDASTHSKHMCALAWHAIAWLVAFVCLKWGTASSTVQQFAHLLSLHHRLKMELIAKVASCLVKFTTVLRIVEMSLRFMRCRTQQTALAFMVICSYSMPVQKYL